MRRYTVLVLLALGVARVLGLPQAAVAATAAPPCKTLQATAPSCDHLVSAMTALASAGAREQLGSPVSEANRVHARARRNRVVFRASTVRVSNHALQALAPAEGGHESVTLVRGTRLPAIGSTLLFAPGRLGVVPRSVRQA